jgi:hypothetical protein
MGVYCFIACPIDMKIASLHPNLAVNKDDSLQGPLAPLQFTTGSSFQSIVSD